MTMKNDFNTTEVLDAVTMTFTEMTNMSMTLVMVLTTDTTEVLNTTMTFFQEVNNMMVMPSVMTLLTKIALLVGCVPRGGPPRRKERLMASLTFPTNRGAAYAWGQED